MVASRKHIQLKKSLHVVIEEDPLIIKVESKDGEFVEVEDVVLMRDANKELSHDAPYYVLLDTTNGYANSSPAANNLMANKDFSGSRKGIAIIARSLATKIVSNFFIRFNRPATPTKVFMTEAEAEAVAWLKQIAK